MQPFITAKQAEIAELCRTHHVRRLSIFGSAVRDDFNPATSDVDVRIEFQPEALESYVKNYHSLHDSLVEMFGRKVTSSVHGRSKILTCERSLRTHR